MGFVPSRAKGPRAAGAQCEVSPVLSRWKGARSGESGGESRQEPAVSALSLSPFPGREG